MPSATSAGVPIQWSHSLSRQALRQIVLFRVHRFRFGHALSHIRAPLCALMLGSLRFIWIRCSARAAFVVGAAAHVPQGGLLFIAATKATTAFHI
jgi:hypothetical protein